MKILLLKLLKIFIINKKIMEKDTSLFSNSFLSNEKIEKNINVIANNIEKIIS
jgi:hypothetical protein